MLCKDLPDAVNRFIMNFDINTFMSATELAQKQSAIREWLKNSDYCAFVANGSILPRAKGTDLPMLDAIPFRSTPNDEIEVCGVRGMGIKKGVTVITGGGYSGKSTLLDAISAGIYDHAIGDGRELCITDESAVTISAEDGRSVKHVNISPFIKWLPGGDTSDFSTDHASGSTSQAANIMEAVDSGANLLLIDEDRSATNFMIRDRMMKELIEKEPITPFTDRVNELHKTHGVSTILVIGGSGEYLSVANKIYMMEDYLIHDVTEKSKNICSSYNVSTVLPSSANWQQCRALYSDGFSSYPDGRGSERLEVSDMGFIIIGDETIDVRGLHDIVSPRQLDTLGFMLRYLEITNNDKKIDIQGKIHDLYTRIYKEGIDFLYSPFFTTCERFLDLPRKQELMALINRMRKINMLKESDSL
jgi:predicted ABC-class ATPase